MSSNIIMPAALYVGGSSIKEFDEEPWEEIERDPRGVLLVWDPPKPNAKYIVGMDASEGITGWSRGTRTDDDYKTDNGVVEVFEIDGAKELLWDEVEEHKQDRRHPGQRTKRIPLIDKHTRQQAVNYRDVQVAEFAAPCDAVEIARIANVVGRLYRGSEEDEAELIWEAFPGCGMLTTQELLRLGYSNLWHWEYITDVAEETNRLGWRSGRESMKILWYRARRHLMQRKAVIRSKWLLDELSGAEIDMNKMRARAAYGMHDDRMWASAFCWWAGHEWTYAEDSKEPVMESEEPLDFQKYAPGLDEDVSYSDWRSTACDGWFD